MYTHLMAEPCECGGCEGTAAPGLGILVPMNPAQLPLDEPIAPSQTFDDLVSWLSLLSMAWNFTR